MYMHTCTYMYVCVCVSCMYTHTHTHVHVYIDIYPCVCVCASVCECVCITYMYAHVCVSVYVFVCLRICMCTGAMRYRRRDLDVFRKGQGQVRIPATCPSVNFGRASLNFPYTSKDWMAKYSKFVFGISSKSAPFTPSRGAYKLATHLPYVVNQSLLVLGFF